MVGGDFMPVYYSSDHRGYYSAAENVGDMLSCHVLHQQNENLMMCATVTFFILHRRKCHKLGLSTWLEKGHPLLH